MSTGVNYSKLCMNSASRLVTSFLPWHFNAELFNFNFQPFLIFLFVLYLFYFFVTTAGLVYFSLSGVHRPTLIIALGDLFTDPLYLFTCAYELVGVYVFVNCFKKIMLYIIHNIYIYALVHFTGPHVSYCRWTRDYTRIFNN